MKKLLLFGIIGASLVYVVFQVVMNNENVITIPNQTPTYRPNYTDLPKEISCHFETSVDGSFENVYSQDPTKRNEQPIPGRSIFFHETSCFADEGTVINARQACAVESAAMMNPNMTVYLLILSPARISNASKRIVRQLTSYDNVRIRRMSIEEHVKNSPLEDWKISEKLRLSRWPKIHMSDIIRYLTLWKFQGIYLDLDVVVTTTLDGLTNFAGAEDWDDVASGVLGFTATDFGRKLIDDCLSDLTKNFRPDVWGYNGPGVITRIAQKICGVTYTKDMTESRCRGLTIFPPSVFYPIHYDNWKNYFIIDNSNGTMNLLKNARAIHVWNKRSSLETVQVGSQVPYAVLASKYCPKVYNNCGRTF